MSTWNRIVVGVDGSKESRQALDWACDQAGPDGKEVLVVSVWSEPMVPVDLPNGAYPWGVATDPVRDLRRMLLDVMSEAQRRYPGVRMRAEISSGHAAQQLIKLSERADQVVVGARGHGGFTGMLIGSVSQHVLAHSTCTVVVVR